MLRKSAGGGSSQSPSAAYTVAKHVSVSGSPTFDTIKANGKVVGVIGVIGPTRLNYARIVPMVDYTARVVGRLLA